MPKYSIVVPLHNEQENVTDLYDRLKAVMEGNGESFEIVLVDDGSTDNTFGLLREIVAVDSRVTVVKLRRNFGQTGDWRRVSIMHGASTSSPWTVTCSMTRRTSRSSWKRLPRGMTLSAGGGGSASTICGCGVSRPESPTG